MRVRCFGDGLRRSSQCQAGTEQKKSPFLTKHKSDKSPKQLVTSSVREFNSTQRTSSFPSGDSKAAKAVPTDFRKVGSEAASRPMIVSASPRSILTLSACL